VFWVLSPWAQKAPMGASRPHPLLRQPRGHFSHTFSRGQSREPQGPGLDPELGTWCKTHLNLPDNNGNSRAPGLTPVIPATQEAQITVRTADETSEATSESPSLSFSLHRTSWAQVLSCGAVESLLSPGP
jgi:hypothetical protein